MSRAGRRSGGLLRAVVAVALVAGAVGVSSPAPAPVSAQTGEAVFDPIASATRIDGGAFGQAVTNGTGTFLEVSRINLVVGQYIAVRRSADGGRTWGVVALLQGESGGATRPHVSISGDSAAVTFIGSACDPNAPDVCPESPYLSVSKDAGRTWGSPRRLATQAFDVWVAQSADRTWVVTELGADLDVRGTNDGGDTWFAERRVTGSFVGVASDDVVAALAYLRRVEVAGETRFETIVQAMDRTDLASAASLGGIGFDDVSPQGIAVADGRVTVVARHSPHSDPGGTARLVVHNGDGGGVFAAPATLSGGNPVPNTTGASIDATHDLVAVSAIVGGTVLVATSSDAGRTFGPLGPVAIHPGAGGVRVGVARRPSDRPTARFSWSVPPRLKDDDGDGIADPANWTGFSAADQLRVAAGRDMAVAVDGCASTVPSGRTIASYRWSTVEDDGSLTTLADLTCAITLDLRSGDVRTLRLDVTDSAGSAASTVQRIAPRNLVVASVGDSIASGEGNPHVDKTSTSGAVWRDRPCHRSAFAGPAVAALRMEVSDPHTSVTFIQLACSGAAMLDVPQLDGPDSPDTGGLLDSYKGQEPEPGSLRPSQLSQLDELLGSGASRRPVDALLLSIGANDAKFSEVVLGCILSLTRCDDPAGDIRTGFEQRFADLPRRYALVADAIDDLGVPASSVHITQYFDPTTDELGVTQLRCVLTNGVIPVVTDDEARWARTAVIGGLHQAVETAAATHGWRYVGGIAAQFERHGYCSSDPWVVRIGESEDRQDNRDGAFHPNLAGHIVYADAIAGSLRQALAAGAPSTPSTTPVPLGDLVVVSSDGTDLRATSVRDTGGEPTTLGIRRIDRVISGDGYLGTFGPPAVDGFAGVVAWTTLPVSGNTRTNDFVAPVAIRPNAAVRQVHVVQAPTRGRTLVADRPSVVLATVDAALERNETVDVRTTVTATVPGGSPRTVLDTTAPVALKPGLNRLILPAGETFTLQTGEVVEATVRVTDPLGADLVDSVDNERTSDVTEEKVAQESRALSVLFVTPPVEGAPTVGCSDAAGLGQIQTAFARAAMPVTAGGVTSKISCTALPTVAASRQGVLEVLAMANGIAHRGGLDIVAAVVPKGWLQAFEGGAVGIAAPGLRAVIIEAGSASMTLAHETSHTFGLGHVKPPRPADGVRVDQRRWIDGTDWMAEEVPTRFWTGAQVWDDLLAEIGPPANAAVVPAPPSPQVNITGTISTDGTNDPGPWTQGSTGSPRDPDDELELERVVARQVGPGGAELDSTELDEGSAAPVGGDPSQPLGTAYTGSITLVDGATAVQILVDGVVVEERPIVDAPTLAVTAPTTTVSVGRGEPLTVEWTSSQPDLPTDLYVSQDGGTTWKPLALAVTGASAEVTVPLDLVDGPAVVRAVQTTGVRSAEADSETFTVGGGATVLPERVVALRVDLIDLTVPGTTMPTVPGNGIATMNPDGTDLVTIVPTVAPGPGVDGFVPLRPDWSPDAQQIAFDAEVAGRRDVYVVARDGSGLRRLTTAASSDGQQLLCADWHPDGTKLLSMRTAGLSASAIGTLELVAVDVATGAVTPLGWSTQSHFRNANDIGCPRWSPDGKEIYAEQESIRTSINDLDHNLFVLDATVSPPRSKYAYAANNGAYQHAGSYARWINADPNGEDRFVTSEVLFSSSSLRTVQPALVPLFIGGGVVTVPLPQLHEQLFGSGFDPNPDQPTGFSRETFGSAGFTPDSTEVWATTNSNLFPARYQETVGCGFFSFCTRIVTARIGHLCTMPVTPVIEPFVTPPKPAGTCYEPGGDGTPVTDLRSTFTTDGTPLPDMPTTGIAMADWSPEITTGAGPEAVAVPDPATVPPDPPDPDPIDVTEPTPSGPAATGADALAPSGSPVTPVDGTVELRPGESTIVSLPSDGGDPTPFTLLERPVPSSVTVTPLDGDGWSTTGPEGHVMLTAAAGFTGTVTLRFGAGDTSAVLTIVVTADPAPTVVGDTITVPAGVTTVIDPTLLLVNDLAGAPAPPPNGRLTEATTDSLRIVAVTGFAAGEARLLADGSVEVTATGAGSFTYVAANSAGVTGSGSVTVVLESPEQEQTTTTTAPPTTTVVTAPSTTAAPPAAPTTSAVVTGGLPRTGGGSTNLVPIGLALVVAGSIALASRARRPSAVSRGRGG
jgi:hypothetical protein